MNSDTSFAVVILAAGRSSRLGSPKQLLTFEGETLVERAARRALESGATEVVVVTGAEADEVSGKLAGLPVRCVFNPLWQEGMGGSIGCGVEAIGADVECVVIALCDQPKITGEHLSRLARRHFESGAPVVASSYDGVVGAPCAFGKSMFAVLGSLAGDIGARELIRRSPNPAEAIAFEGGRLDVDTRDEYDALTSEIR